MILIPMEVDGHCACCLSSVFSFEMVDKEVDKFLGRVFEQLCEGKQK
jgi:hypothetical protein